MPAPSSQTNDREAELIRRVCCGEHEAFYELVRPYERAIYFAAIGVLSNPADAEEVAQETVLKAFNALPKFRFEAKFSTWIIQIAINESRMKLRKDRRHLYESIEAEREDEEGDYRPKDLADWRDIPSEALQRKELRDALKRAMTGLAPKYREVLILRDVQHVSITETANILGITEASVKTRLLRARLQMREALAPGIDGSWTTGREEFKKIRPWS
jgi:RNA polymerase sigma-70 factor (ECF subfamily)